MNLKRSLLYALVLMISLGLGIASAQDDPFAGLGGGEDDGLAAPDGSSSIRAKRKASKAMFEGTVISVSKKGVYFPRVLTVKVKVTKASKSKTAPHNEIKKDQIYTFMVNYVEKDGKIVMKDKDNQANIGAYYLEKGDKVMAEVKDKLDKTFRLLYIERK